MIKNIWNTLFSRNQSATKIESSARREAANALLFKKLETFMVESHAYLQANCKREQLAIALETNECYLSQAIRQSVDMTINEYINRYRLEYAVKLIKEVYEYAPISLIAKESGFASNRHFYRLFRQKYNMSPVKYRKIEGLKTKN